MTYNINLTIGKTTLLYFTLVDHFSYSWPQNVDGSRFWWLTTSYPERVEEDLAKLTPK